MFCQLHPVGFSRKVSVIIQIFDSLIAKILNSQCAQILSMQYPAVDRMQEWERPECCGVGRGIDREVYVAGCVIGGIQGWFLYEGHGEAVFGGSMQAIDGRSRVGDRIIGRRRIAE